MKKMVKKLILIFMFLMFFVSNVNIAYAGNCQVCCGGICHSFSNDCDCTVSSCDYYCNRDNSALWVRISATWRGSCYAGQCHGLCDTHSNNAAYLVTSCGPYEICWNKYLPCKSCGQSDCDNRDRYFIEGDKYCKFKDFSDCNNYRSGGNCVGCACSDGTVTTKIECGTCKRVDKCSSSAQTCSDSPAGTPCTGGKCYDGACDSVKPTISVLGAPETGEEMAGAIASVSCSDDTSGCNEASKKLFISSTSSCPSDYGSYALSSPQLITAHVWVCAAAKDNAGNADFSSSEEFKINQTAPVYWANMLENKISKTQIKDMVKLVAKISGAEGRTTTFGIYQSNSIFGMGILDWMIPDNKVTSISAPFSSNVAVATWEVPDKKIYYASANISGIDTMITSENLDAYNTIPDNTAPVAKITTPPSGSVFKTNAPITFAQDSYDEDDALAYLWGFGNTATSTEQNPSYTYADTGGGPKTITLAVTDSRGLKSNDTARILIDSAANDAPLAIISSPKSSSIIRSNVVFCNSTLSIDDLTPFENLIFSWTFDDKSAYTANGMKGALFNKTYASAGMHWAGLSVSD